MSNSSDELNDIVNVLHYEEIVTLLRDIIDQTFSGSSLDHSAMQAAIIRILARDRIRQ
jgi:hypothetical protein